MACSGVNRLQREGPGLQEVGSPDQGMPGEPGITSRLQPLTATNYRYRTFTPKVLSIKEKATRIKCDLFRPIYNNRYLNIYYPSISYI